MSQRRRAASSRRKAGILYHFRLSLSTSEPNAMKLAVTLAAVALAAAGAAQAQNAADLLKKHACTACHAVDKKLVGPAYNDVAAKYKGDAKAATALMEKVKKGGVGAWGQVPMPPNPQVPDADIKTMVTYILSLKK